MGAWEEAMERWSVVSFVHVFLVMQGDDREKHYAFRQIVDLLLSNLNDAGTRFLQQWVKT